MTGTRTRKLCEVCDRSELAEVSIILILSGFGGRRGRVQRTAPAIRASRACAIELFRRLQLPVSTYRLIELLDEVTQ